MPAFCTGQVVESRSDGFAPGDTREVIERYLSGSERDLSGFGFYLGLATFKLAAIVESIHFRHLSGQTVGPGYDGIGDLIHPLLEAGLGAGLAWVAYPEGLRRSGRKMNGRSSPLVEDAKTLSLVLTHG